MAKVYAVSVGVLLASAAVVPFAFATDSSDTETTITTEGDAPKTLDRNFPFATDGTIEVSNVRGNVTITGGNHDGIKLGGSLGAGSKLAVEGNARRLEMRVEAEKGSWFGGNGPRNDTNLMLDVPHGVSVKLDVVSSNGILDNVDGKSIEVNNVSGNVRVAAAAHSIEIDSVSGDVILRVTRAGATERAHLQTVSGNIKADGADGRVKLETVSGTVTFAAPTVTELGAESVSGNIEATFVPTKGARVRAETMSGNLRLHLPADLAARIHAETFSGSLKTDYGKVVKAEFGPGSSLDVDSGDSGTRIDAQSFSGNVELHKQ